MIVSEIISGARAKGVADFGLTDHLHTPFNLPDLRASRDEYLANHPSPSFHFGVEVSCVSQWELDEIAAGKHENPVYGVRSGGPRGGPPAIALTAAEVELYVIEYVIGGAHWPMYVPLEREAIIRDYHRQNMFLACHTVVDIVAHPWWWHGHWQDSAGFYSAEPWLDDFGKIPQSVHDEFAAAAIQHGTAVEINLNAMLLTRRYPDTFKRQYLEYLAGLRARGVQLCAGSDCHRAQYDVDLETAAAMLDRVGIRDEDLWRLPPRQQAHGEADCS